MSDVVKGSTRQDIVPQLRPIIAVVCEASTQVWLATLVIDC